MKKQRKPKFWKGLVVWYDNQFPISIRDVDYDEEYGYIYREIKGDWYLENIVST